MDRRLIKQIAETIRQADRHKTHAYDTAATVRAYGNCVETWLTWLHWAPAEAIMVVSEMGEQWSPQTAPAIQAETATMVKVPSVAPNTLSTMGIRIPKVPHEVPVENAIKLATMNMMTGIKLGFRLERVITDAK